MENNNDISELVEVMKEIRDCLVQLVKYKHDEDKITFIQRKDIKSIFNCTDTTVAKIFNRPDFPAIMIGEHKVEKKSTQKMASRKKNIVCDLTYIY